jgi:hypothetical protein
MDRLLLRGEQINSVARRVSVSADAVFRHKKHMQLVMAKAAVTEHRDVAYGSALLAEVSRIRADAERLQLEYESRRDARVALFAAQNSQLSRTVKLTHRTAYPPRPLLRLEVV